MRLQSCATVRSTIILCILPYLCEFCDTIPVKFARKTRITTTSKPEVTSEVTDEETYDDDYDYMATTSNYEASIKNSTVDFKTLYNYFVLKKKSQIYEHDEQLKPPYTYIRLTLQALLSVPENKMTLQEIFSFIMQKYAFYRSPGAETLNWQHSIRRVLVQRDGEPLFVRHAADKVSSTSQPKSGRRAGYWSFNKNFEVKAYEEAYREGRHWC